MTDDRGPTTDSSLGVRRPVGAFFPAITPDSASQTKAPTGRRTPKASAVVRARSTRDLQIVEGYLAGPTRIKPGDALFHFIVGNAIQILTVDIERQLGSFGSHFELI